MKKTLLLILILLSAIYAYAQIHATTESGNSVLLSEDGTWTYVDHHPVGFDEIRLNDTEFFRGKHSTLLVKSEKLNIGIWMDPYKWSVNRTEREEGAEYQFESMETGLYGVLIPGKEEVPMETLREVALENAKSVSPDVEVVKEEYRNVNGIQVLMMQMTGTVQGMDVVYCGYYYASANGTMQLLTYTAQRLFDGYVKDTEAFLNGFVVM